MVRQYVAVFMICLAALAAVLGYRLGRVPSETEIINRFAALYMAEDGVGRMLADCVARPAPQDGVRLRVICTPPSGAVVIYYAGPRGREVDLPDPPADHQA